MKSLFIAVMLIATMLLSASVIAAPKHQGAKHGQDASKPAAEVPDTPPEEPVDTSWKGKLGGMVTAMGGAGLAEQLHVHPAWIGVASIALAVILLLVIVLMIVRVVGRSRRGPAVYAGGFADSEISKKPVRVEPNIKPVAARAAALIAKSQAAAKDHVDFDVQKFLRSANTYFLRLQTAWDRKDTDDLKQFVTQEIYAELKTQLKQRGDAFNKTGVDTLDAELLKLETGDGKYVASVKFSGMIREEGNQANPFVEVWSLTKRLESTGGWRLAGIQQFS